MEQTTATFFNGFWWNYIYMITIKSECVWHFFIFFFWYSISPSITELWALVLQTFVVQINFTSFSELQWNFIHITTMKGRCAWKFSSWFFHKSCKVIGLCCKTTVPQTISTLLVDSNKFLFTHSLWKVVGFDFILTACPCSADLYAIGRGYFSKSECKTVLFSSLK